MLPSLQTRKLRWLVEYGAGNVVHEIEAERLFGDVLALHPTEEGTIERFREGLRFGSATGLYIYSHSSIL